MRVSLAAKHAEYYARVVIGEGAERKEKWIPLLIPERDHRKKEATMIVERLSEPGAIDFSDLDKTNATLKDLGLPLFDEGWSIARGKRKPRAPGRPREYPAEPPMGKKEANDMLSLLRARKDVLFGDYLKWWLASEENKLQVHTYDGYKTTVDHIIAPFFDGLGITLASLSPEDIDSFYSKMSSLHRSGSTLCHYHAIMRKALQNAYRRGYVDSNACDRVERPKKEPYMGKFLNRDEMVRVMEAAKGTPIEFPVYMACHYGLRREEVCALRYDAFDFLEKTMAIKRTVGEYVKDGRYGLVFRETTKTKSSFRTLPLTDEAISLIVGMRMKEDASRAKWGNRYNNDYDGYVMVNQDGSFVKPSFVTANFERLLVKMGLPKMRFHDLRHSCATLLRREGVPMEDIQKWLGHSSIVTTESIYAHYDDSQSLKTMEKMSLALDGGGKGGSELN